MASNSIPLIPQTQQVPQAAQIPQVSQTPQTAQATQMVQPLQNTNMASTNSVDLFKKKQPEVANPKMQGEAPKVGVVDVPNMSNMPLKDSFKKENNTDNPKIKEKKNKMDGSVKLDIMAVIACVAGLAIAIFKKSKP